METTRTKVQNVHKVQTYLRNFRSGKG